MHQHVVRVSIVSEPLLGLDEKRKQAVRHVRVRKSLHTGDGRTKSLRGLTRDKCVQFRKSEDTRRRLSVETRRNHTAGGAF